MFWNRCGELKYEAGYVGTKVTHNITVDGKPINLPSCPVGQKYTAKKILSAHGYYGKTGSMGFLKKFAVPASRVAQIANAGAFKATVKPYMEFSSLLYKNGRVDQHLYTLVVENWDLVQETKQDGLKNIIPFVAYFGENPQQLRKRLGKGMWKKVCGNTYSRNILLAQKSLLADLGNFVDLPSTVLRTTWKSDFVYWVARQQSVPLAKAIKAVGKRGSDFRKLYDTVNDCHLMAQANNLPFSLSWSARRMKEEHDNLVRLEQTLADQRRAEWDKQYAAKLEKARTVNLADRYKTTNWVKDGAQARLLTTYDEVRQEGVLMHHCVSSYAMQVADGEYLVLHISSNEYESTCGMFKSNGKWYIQQHYGACNDSRVPKSHYDVVNLAITELNEMQKGAK